MLFAFIISFRQQIEEKPLEYHNEQIETVGTIKVQFSLSKYLSIDDAGYL